MKVSLGPFPKPPIRPEFSAEFVGSMTRRVVRPNSFLTVTAVFDNSLYFANKLGEMACLLGPGKEPGPLHIVCNEWPESMHSLASQDEEVVARFPLLLFQRFRIDLSTGENWHPPTPAMPVRELVRQRFPAIREQINAAAPPDALLRHGIFRNPDTPAESEATGVAEVLVRFIKDGMAVMAAALDFPCPHGGEPLPNFSAQSRAAAFRKAAKQLLGLGNGLTPTGDDILAGIMLSLRLLRDDENADFLAAAATANLSATNRISAAHLEAAAAGQGAEAFHQFFTIATGRRNRIHLLPPLLHRINMIGHSSGWDTLFGMMWTLEKWCERY